MKLETTKETIKDVQSIHGVLIVFQDVDLPDPKSVQYLHCVRQGGMLQL